MKSIPSHEKLSVALAVLERLNPPTSGLTLADLDNEQDFEPLDALVYAYSGPYCLTIEFNDDNHKHDSRRALEYVVKTPCGNGYVDRDEDGAYQDTNVVREKIWVFVHPEMTIEQIAEAVRDEVRGIENNVLA
ncbi:hypothetical protein [Spirosoma validum]|uniref:Uncharacterized protein n=1 Tax=Spirosoma validum TaxID=2771355 RepID=A0A927B1R7_9BACT|nr:hypothetical protein [Spirosoma validum]MBD2753823.1 hypothetical protein [Spirosoma validum]